MSVVEMLTDLLTAIPFWVLIGFLFCLVNFCRKTKHRNTYLGGCLVLGVLNVLLSLIHYTALFNAGPLRGVVIDRETGKPVAGVRVVALWDSPSLAPVATPVWIVVLHKLTNFDCQIVSKPMITNASGEFKANVWYGAKVWHGCSSGRFNASMEGYQPTLGYRNNEAEARKVSVFFASQIVLDKKAPW